MVLTDNLAAIVVSVSIALCMAGAISFVSARILWLESEQKICSFIIGFALMSSLAVAQLAPDRGWRTMLLLCSLPTLLVFVYFLPTFLALAADSHIHWGVFLINLAFGWTLIGWIVAIMMAFRPKSEDLSEEDAAFRLTPLGMIPRTGIGCTAEERLKEPSRSERSTEVKPHGAKSNRNRLKTENGSTANPDAVMNVSDVAKYLNVNRSTIHRLVKRGELSGFRIGSNWQFNREDVERWLRSATSGDRMLSMARRRTAAIGANEHLTKKRAQKLASPANADSVKPDLLQR